MLKDKLKIIISEFQSMPLPGLLERELVVDLAAVGSPVNKVITIVGPRRAGKTFYLFQIMKRLVAGGRDIRDFVYVNFEDERILPMTAADLQLIVDAWRELHGRQDRPLLFLDEVQNINGWETFVRRLADQGYAVFVSGSNSRLLSSEIATALRGRTLTYTLLPFSFREFLAIRQVAPERSLPFGPERHRAQQLFESYLALGGYPEVIQLDNAQTRTRVLQDYFHAVFFRDLVERYRIKHSEILRQWLDILVKNCAALVSLRKVENDFRSRGMAVSVATLAAFARYVEEIFFGFFVEMHAESVRKRQINPKKFYLIDLGLHRFLSLGCSADRGRSLENVVFLELKRQGQKVNYYRTSTGAEVDFLVQSGGEPRLIQVCHALDRLATANREKKALQQAMKELGLTTGLLLTAADKADETSAAGTIHIRPVWEWAVAG
ncbi:MAG: ATP-binding protein [Thermodesulfobacteriota bacterium]